MEITEPQITVLMPAYNAGPYITQAVESVLLQSFINFELLIVNDGSTDDTLEKLSSFNDKRIIIINKANNGVASALNAGLKHASAPYIARFDADDICHPRRLELQYEFMLANPQYHIIGSAADYMDMDGNYVFNYQPPGHNNEQIQQLPYTACPFIHSSVFYRRNAVIANGGYNQNALGFEDHLLWRNMVQNGKAFNFSQPLIKVRLNPASVTIDEKWSLRRFRQIKYRALQKAAISDIEGRELLQLSKLQCQPEIKKGAYNALLAKKFLWNNYQPVKARQNLKQVLKVNPLHITSYGLFFLSFLPGAILLKLYNTLKKCSPAF